MTPAAEAKNITISSEFTSDGELTIIADPDRLQQIIWNLLSNAVKFTPKNGRVFARVRREGSHVCIHISDTGEGIRPELLAAIFEPFHQADASTTRRHGGLGLGLAIVKQLVTAHGGTVRATSDGLGNGATFVVQLPARATAPAVLRAPHPLVSLDLAQLAASGGAPRLDGLELLVIDDEQDVLAW